MVCVVRQHPLDARADALHPLDLRPRGFSAPFPVPAMPFVLPFPPALGPRLPLPWHPASPPPSFSSLPASCAPVRSLLPCACPLPPSAAARAFAIPLPMPLPFPTLAYPPPSLALRSHAAPPPAAHPGSLRRFFCPPRVQPGPLVAAAAASCLWLPARAGRAGRGRSWRPVAALQRRQRRAPGVSSVGRASGGSGWRGRAVCWCGTARPLCSSPWLQRLVVYPSARRLGPARCWGGRGLGLAGPNGCGAPQAGCSATCQDPCMLAGQRGPQPGRLERLSLAGARSGAGGLESGRAARGCLTGSSAGTATSARPHSSRPVVVSPSHPGETGERERYRWCRRLSP